MKITLLQKRPENSEVTSFVFTADIPITYKAGQHVSVMAPITHPDERGKVRTFTLSSSPTETNLMITTKRGPSSFKQYLFMLDVGSQLEARGPSGTMFLEETESSPVVCLAGGIGITPFRSMLRYAADTHMKTPITVLYSIKTPQDAVFTDELNALHTIQANIQVVRTLTGENMQDAWTGRLGRIDASLIKEYAPDIHGRFFVAGPTGMVEDILAALDRLGVAHDRIRFEKFTGY